MKASSGIELMVSLDRDSAVGLRAQLEHQLREGVRSGTLRHGAALPSTRALARELGVARGVVMEAYAQLAAEGYLVSSQGAPTRVAARAARAGRRGGAGRARAPRFDFRPGAPDVSLFPRMAWAAALRQALRDAPDARFSYSDPRGTPELRGALATYLGRVRGVAADPETVMVTSGLTQGLVLTCRALAARGVRRIAVEEPGSADLRAPIAAVGLEWVPVAVDDDGLDVGALARSDAARCWSRPRTSTPPASCSPPSGARRCSRGRAARDAFVLEDDYDAEYRYDRQPVGALQGLDPERVVYIGLDQQDARARAAARLARRAAGAARRRSSARRLADDRGTPGSTQLGLAVLLERGELDRHVRRTRPSTGAGATRSSRRSARHLPELRPHGAAAGLHLLVDLPAEVDEAARRRGRARARRRPRRPRPACGPPARPGGDPRLRPDRRAGDRARGPRARGGGRRRARADTASA